MQVRGNDRPNTFSWQKGPNSVPAIVTFLNRLPTSTACEPHRKTPHHANKQGPVSVENATYRRGSKQPQLNYFTNCILMGQHEQRPFLVTVLQMRGNFLDMKFDLDLALVPVLRRGTMLMVRHWR